MIRVDCNGEARKTSTNLGIIVCCIVCCIRWYCFQSHVSMICPACRLRCLHVETERHQTSESYEFSETVSFLTSCLAREEFSVEFSVEFIVEVVPVSPRSPLRNRCASRHHLFGTDEETLMIMIMKEQKKVRKYKYKYTVIYII